MAQCAKEKETYLARLRHMCKDLDKSGDGRVDQKDCLFEGIGSTLVLLVSCLNKASSSSATTLYVKMRQPSHFGRALVF